MSKEYLGDGAFVQHGCYQGEVILTTEDGIRETNRVVLGSKELEHLLIWLETQFPVIRVTIRRHEEPRSEDD